MKILTKTVSVCQETNVQVHLRCLPDEIWAWLSPAVGASRLSTTAYLQTAHARPRRNCSNIPRSSNSLGLHRARAQLELHFLLVRKYEAHWPLTHWPRFSKQNSLTLTILENLFIQWSFVMFSSVQYFDPLRGLKYKYPERSAEVWGAMTGVCSWRQDQPGRQVKEGAQHITHCYVLPSPHVTWTSHTQHRPTGALCPVTYILWHFHKGIHFSWNFWSFCGDRASVKFLRFNIDV